MFIVTVKSIDADSFALPTLYGKTTSQNYNFSMNPQGNVTFLVNNLSYKKINRQRHGQYKPHTQPNNFALLLLNLVALPSAHSAGLLC